MSFSVGYLPVIGNKNSIPCWYYCPNFTISNAFGVIVLRDDLGADPASCRLKSTPPLALPNSLHRCDNRRHRHVVTPCTAKKLLLARL